MDRRVSGRSPSTTEQSGSRGLPNATSVLAALLLAALTACGDAPEPWTSPIPFDTARARVLAGGDTIPLLVEVAETDEQRRYGLSRRPALDSASGMIFLYDSVRPDSTGFWMWRTRIPLDIAYLDSAGRILAVRGMDACDVPDPDVCRTYRAGVEYRAALEVNRGWFARHGVEVGDTVRLNRGG